MDKVYTFDQLGNLITSYDFGGSIKPTIEFIDGLLNMVLNSKIFNLCYDMLVPIGIILCAVYFGVELMDRASSTNFSVETIIRQFLRFFIVVVLISNLPNFLLGMVQFSIFLCKELLETVDITAIRDVYPAMNYTIGFSTYRTLSNLISNTFLTYVLRIFGVFVGISRAFTVAFKCFLAPIIVPDMYNNGLNSSSMKFLRGFLADCMQTTAIVVVYCICMYALSGETEAYAAISAFLGPFIGFIMALVLIGALPKTNHYINQMLEGMTTD